jgi:hypothetical protein
MTPTTTIKSLLLSVAAILLVAACPLYQATYALQAGGSDLMRIGPAPDGEVILRFVLGSQERSIALAQVIDHIQFERLDAERRPVAPDTNVAPAYIRIEGLARISDVPDGEWQLAECSQ